MVTQYMNFRGEMNSPFATIMYSTAPGPLSGRNRNSGIAKANYPMSLLPYALARPFLFGLDPERAHDFTMASLAFSHGTPLALLYHGACDALHLDDYSGEVRICAILGDAADIVDIAYQPALDADAPLGLRRRRLERV